MSLTNVGENEVLDAMLGASATLYGSSQQLALSTSDPGETGAGITEPSGNGYARVTINNDGTNWAAASSGSKENAATISFPLATGSWGSIQYWALYDGGVMKHYGVTDNGSGTPATITVANGDVLRFLAGALRITAD